MPYRPALKCPSLAFLEEVERTLSIVWPEAFRAFCRVHAGASLNDKYPALRGRFICDLAALQETNGLIGGWDLLPFYVVKKDVFGFQTSEPGSDKVVMWSVHTTVHEDPMAVGRRKIRRSDSSQVTVFLRCQHLRRETALMLGRTDDAKCGMSTLRHPMQWTV